MNQTENRLRQPSSIFIMAAYTTSLMELVGDAVTPSNFEKFPSTWFVASEITVFCAAGIISANVVLFTSPVFATLSAKSLNDPVSVMVG